MKLPLKVIPGASSDAIVGWQGDALKLKVRAAPEKGRANKAVIALLASKLDIPAAAMSIESGHSSQRKILAVDDAYSEDFKCALKQVIEQ